MKTIACLAALAASASAAFVSVPGGLKMDEKCIYNTDNKPFTLSEFSECESKSVEARKQTYAMSINNLPDDVLKTQMNTSWNVPQKPSRYDGQVVYFWPGFKTTHPKMGLPVLQPVLQYGQHGPEWELQSWFVHGDVGVSFTGKRISVQAGDEITSYMVYLKDTDEWVCSATVVRTGEISYLRFKASRISNVEFRYAMLVLETITPNEDCDLYPVGTSVTFSNVKVNNKILDKYQEVYTEHQCRQNITDVSPGVVKFSWKQ